MIRTISSLTSQAMILFLPLSIRQRQRIRKTSISAVRGHTVLIREALTLQALIPTISPAEYKNGILTLDLPKMQEVKPETKRLEIK